jgi:transposase-like protein
MPDATYPPLRMRFSFESRCRIVRLILAGESPQAAAAACGASRATSYRLWGRYQEGGWEALRDPSRPKRQPRRLAPESVSRDRRLASADARGPARAFRDPRATGLNDREGAAPAGVSPLPKPPRDPVVRYERERAGELLHVDSKRLNRFWHVGRAILKDGRRCSTGAGWHFLHVAIDDHSPGLCGGPGERRRPGVRGLPRPRARLVSRNRASSSSASLPTMQAPIALVPGGSSAPAPASAAVSPDPSVPRPNGKAEALIKTLLREWAYRFGLPDERAAQPSRSPATSGGTTSADHRARWAGARRSAVSHTSVVSTPRETLRPASRRFPLWVPSRPRSSAC